MLTTQKIISQHETVISLPKNATVITNVSANEIYVQIQTYKVLPSVADTQVFLLW